MKKLQAQGLIFNTESNPLFLQIKKNLEMFQVLNNSAYKIDHSVSKCVSYSVSNNNNP